MNHIVSGWPMTRASVLTRKPRFRRADVLSHHNGHANPTSAPRAAIALTSAATACAVFILGALAETWLISLLRPSEGELTWIGDLVLAVTLGVVLFAERFVRTRCPVTCAPTLAAPLPPVTQSRPAPTGSRALMVQEQVRRYEG